MAHVIDLKNKQPEEPKLSTDSELATERTIPAHKLRIISWSSPWHYRPDIKFLVSVSLILFVIAALIQIFQKNTITTIFFALLGLVILLNSKRKLEINKFEINPAGVSINAKIYHFQEIKSFWIEYEPSLGIKELSLQLKRWHAPYVKIPLDNQDPLRLRLALLEFLPEVEHKDSIVEILSRKLGL